MISVMLQTATSVVNFDPKRTIPIFEASSPMFDLRFTARFDLQVRQDLIAQYTINYDDHTKSAVDVFQDAAMSILTSGTPQAFSIYGHFKLVSDTTIDKPSWVPDLSTCYELETNLIEQDPGTSVLHNTLSLSNNSTILTIKGITLDRSVESVPFPAKLKSKPLTAIS